VNIHNDDEDGERMLFIESIENLVVEKMNYWIEMYRMGKKSKTNINSALDIKYHIYGKEKGY
jgi:homoserine trans-succinylase